MIVSKTNLFFQIFHFILIFAFLFHFYMA